MTLTEEQIDIKAIDKPKHKGRYFPNQKAAADCFRRLLARGNQARKQNDTRTEKEVWRNISIYELLWDKGLLY